jgi:beta-aspartyl-dipeptidase (metallo-type)
LYIDFDVTDGRLQDSLLRFDERKGDWRRLTLSSDADSSSPTMIIEQVAACARSGRWPLERLLPLITANPASALKLQGKGRIGEGCDADILVLSRGTLSPVNVVARGRVMMRDGRIVTSEEFLQKSNRHVTLHGEA